MRNDVSSPWVNRTAVFILAVCMVILGILFLMKPIITEIVAMYFACFGFMAYGVFQIVTYVRTPREYKNGWLLAQGIIYILLGILLITERPGAMYMTFAFILGFIALFNGINEITVFSVMHRVSGSGLILLSGIINCVLSIFLLLTPFVATWALGYVCGIYLIVGGISFFIEAGSGHYGVKS